MARARVLKNRKSYLDTLFLYDTLQCLGIESKSLYDQIDPKLIGSNIY